MAVRALGFATNNFSATVANETATAFGSADVFGEWIATTPFANGQVQVFNFNIFDPAYEGGGLSDTLSIVLSGRQPTVLDPNNMTINFSFRSDNLSGTPALGALFGGISITESGYFQSVNAFLPAQFVGDVAAPLTVSFRSDVVPEPSAIQFGLLSLASLPFLLRLRNKR